MSVCVCAHQHGEFNNISDTLLKCLKALFCPIVTWFLI